MSLYSKANKGFFPVIRYITTGFLLPLVLITTISPVTAYAFGGDFLFLGSAVSASTDSSVDISNSQTLDLLTPSLPHSMAQAKNMGNGVSKEVAIADNEALVGSTGPLGTAVDVIDIPEEGDVTVYTVRSGDTVESIAKMFDINTDTLRWANDLSKGEKVKVGTQLIILPVEGVYYEVKKGDTIKSIAKKFNADPKDIIAMNEFGDDGNIQVGDEIIVPNGKVSEVKKPTSSGTVISPTTSKTWVKTDGFFIRPVPNAPGVHFVRGKHGSICRNGVDIGGPIGTPIFAAADGIVILSRDSGWNGGAGKFVAIQHRNGTKTWYVHLSGINAQTGQTVSQGDVIGYLGNSGHSTGPHLHFEVCGGTNPLVANRNYGL